MQFDRTVLANGLIHNNSVVWIKERVFYVYRNASVVNHGYVAIIY